MRNFLYAARPILTDMVASIAFAVLYGFTDNLVVSTAVAMALGIGQVGLEIVRRKPVPGLQWASLGLVTVLGGITLFTGDPRFVMIKPTVAYLTVGAAMMQRGWMDRYIPPAAHAYLPKSLIVAFGYIWSGLMFATGVANLVIAVEFGRTAWLAFVAVFPLASKLGLFGFQYALFRFLALRAHRAEQSALTEAQPA
ncbi:MAG: septation protein IspZ [Caulobacteraceae bacterium]|jgi:intracellular septation protein A